MSRIPATASPDSFRPLPARPNLEFERKRAKRLLRNAPPGSLKLSDVHFTIAREYGFASWPKLVEYFNTWAHHEGAGPENTLYWLGYYEDQAAGIIRMHARHLNRAGMYLAPFVPRFYALSDAEIFAAPPVTIEEARLAVARMNRFPSWEVLAASVPAAREAPKRAEEMTRMTQVGPLYEARAALQAHDPDALAAIDDPATLTQLLTLLWLRVNPADIELLLDHGADPNALPPNGIPILEHALLKYWNGDAVDPIARRVVPRKALWIAAGLGDVKSLERYFDRNGELTEAARINRPDFLAVGSRIPCRPGVSDREIIAEAFFIAAGNQRTATMDALLARGHHIDFTPWEQPLLNFAVLNRMVRLVELLDERGASWDVRGVMPGTTARENVPEVLERDPADPAALRIAEICLKSPSNPRV